MCEIIIQLYKLTAIKFTVRSTTAQPVFYPGRANCYVLSRREYDKWHMKCNHIPEKNGLMINFLLDQEICFDAPMSESERVASHCTISQSL